MIKTDPEVLGLFSIPVYKTYLPNNLSNIVEWFNNHELKNKNVDIANFNGEVSKNTYILNEPECKDIANFILSKSKDFGKNYLYLGEKEYQFSQSCLSIKKHSQQHAPHSHGNSIISGVLYYGSIEKNTPGIGFIKPHYTPPSYFLDPGWVEGYNPMNESTILEAIPGIMYLFPSYLPHFVPQNNSKTDRKCVAFNILPKGSLGSEDDLTKLKLL